MKFDVNDLPSGGIPYALKSIDVQPFRPRHMPYISEAILAENNGPLIEAVGMVMDFDVNQLTDGDFYYILTWLRFHSRDIPIYATWDCEGTLFRRKDTGAVYSIDDIDEMVVQWEKAKGTEAEATMEDPQKIEFEDIPCTHSNRIPTKFEDFHIMRMSDVPLDDRLDYPRVRHMVEFMDLVRENRFTKVIGPVRYIKDGFNLRAKLEIVDELEDMSLFDAASRAHFDYEHGVLQRITKKCEVCGTTHDFNVTIDAQSFFV